MKTNVWITHVYFVDDLFVVGNGTIKDAKAIAKLLDPFSKASR